MRRTHTRSAFTLVELLVVMTIIAILIALTAAAVVKAIAKADETKTRSEISQLAQSVQGFKTDFQVSYIPDKLVLPPGYDPTGASQQYITSLWPRIYAPAGDIGTLSASTSQFTKNGQPFKLNGVQYTPFTYWRVPGNQPIILQGYQTLVFFLGGSWDPTQPLPVPDRLGFSTDPTDPMNITVGGLGATQRKGPYYEFPTGRLAVLASDLTTTGTKTAAPFPSFIDVYGSMPYLYFSASKAGNDYNTNYSSSNGYQQGYSTSSGTPTYFFALPFKASNLKFANANGFQIIAAGRDGLFHTQPPSASLPPPYYVGDTLWAGYPGGATDLPGYDNMSNFHPTLLGIPAQ